MGVMEDDGEGASSLRAELSSTLASPEAYPTGKQRLLTISIWQEVYAMEKRLLHFLFHSFSSRCLSYSYCFSFTILYHVLWSWLSRPQGVFPAENNVLAVAAPPWTRVWPLIVLSSCSSLSEKETCYCMA